MHKDSFDEMRRIIEIDLRLYHDWSWQVLDVGSMKVNDDFPHTYRELMPPNWTYLGIDLKSGPNVDRIMHHPYCIHPKGEFYDLVICGQVLEHVPNPFRLVAEMARVLKPEGLLIIVGPWRHDHFHAHPVDCWRILPDGLRACMQEAGLRIMRANTLRDDCWGIGRKPARGRSSCLTEP